MKRLGISLRIHHPFMELRDITNALSVKPTGGWTAGNLSVTPAGRPIPSRGTRKETYWYRSLPLSQKAQLGISLKTLINRFSKHKRFFAKIRRDGGLVEFYVGWFIAQSSGAILDQEVLKGLSDLHIDLGLDLYLDLYQPYHWLYHHPYHMARKRSR